MCHITPPCFSHVPFFFLYPSSYLFSHKAPPPPPTPSIIPSFLPFFLPSFSPCLSLLPCSTHYFFPLIRSLFVLILSSYLPLPFIITSFSFRFLLFHPLCSIILLSPSSLCVWVLMNFQCVRTDINPFSNPVEKSGLKWVFLFPCISSYYNSFAHYFISHI